MTRGDQQAATVRGLLAIMVVAAITLAASVDALRLGAAAAGLLYLLPVLWASARAGLSAGLASAAVAAFCYNFFLLEPRYTLRIHGVGDLAAFLVLTVVAVVTSRLAADLRTREMEARDRAAASESEAALARSLARLHDREALDATALRFMADRFGTAHLVTADDLAARRSGLAPLDAAAAAWALHNGALTGRASEVMPTADFRFVPLGRGANDVLALGLGRSSASDEAQALARLWVQARDQLTAEHERQAREGSESREEVRRALLAALGHDFRTPLTVLKSGLAELAGDAPLRLARQVDRLIALSDDLIAAARLECGAPVALEPIDLVDVVASVATAHSQRDVVAIESDVPDDLPLVAGDGVMLVHLIGNLVENALRHARSQVVVTARSTDDGVRLTVSDDGDGIDPAVADTLFDRFVTGSDREGGSGLGLAIARDLASAMGGALTASSSNGGACFALTLRASVPIEAARP